MIRKLLIPLTLLVATLATTVTSAGAAPANRHELRFTATVVAVGEPAREWVSGHVWHLRDVPYTAVLSGDIDGTAELLLNVNLDLRTFDGTLWGTYSTGGDGFTGRVNGIYRGGLLVSGTSSAHGSGGTGPAKLLTTLVETAPGVIEHDAVLLTPRG